MNSFSLSHLADGTLTRDLHALIARDRSTTAQLLAHLAEFDERRLYLPAGFPSMYVYCVEELRLSEDAAYKRIQAARAGRRFPALFIAVAEGQLNLTGVGLLAPHLTLENVAEMLEAARGRKKAEIEEWLARRFPRSESLPMLEVLPSASPRPGSQLAPAQVGDGLGPEKAVIGAPQPRLSPVAPDRFMLQVSIGRETREKLEHAQALLSHQIPTGEIAEVFDRALDALIMRLEKQKFAASGRPRPPGGSGSSRHVPAHIRRAVWDRDEGQCTFVSDDGHRCPSRKFLEFDHVEPVARGGQASMTGIRLRCRAHNQYEAERVFGAEFMRRKRREATKRSRAGHKANELAKNRAEELIPGLRHLGFTAEESRRASAFCEPMSEASLEERFRAALSYLRPKAKYGQSVSASP
jgi:hypothetical protein